MPLRSLWDLSGSARDWTGVWEWNLRVRTTRLPENPLQDYSYVYLLFSLCHQNRLLANTAHLYESLFNPFFFSRINQVPLPISSAGTNYQFWFFPSLWRVTLRSMLTGVLFHFFLHLTQFLLLLVTLTILLSEFFKLTPTSANMDSVSALDLLTAFEWLLREFWLYTVISKLQVLCWEFNHDYLEMID